MFKKLFVFFKAIAIAISLASCSLDSSSDVTGGGSTTGVSSSQIDNTPPSTPTNLRASSSYVHVTLTWQPSTDNVGVIGYEIIRDGASIAFTNRSEFIDTNSLIPETTYTYQVVAYDLEGNSSGISTATNTTLPASPLTGAPIILYTDITSGPSSGGEGNNGAYLSIFGFNFGSAVNLGTTTKLYINDFEVANYILLVNAKAQIMPNVRAMQQITVQVGALGGSTPGVNLPIKLVVNGVASNTDNTFMIQPGDIYYVDNVIGNDATGVKNDPTQPYRFVQTSGGGGALNIGGPGDFIVMRGTGTDWTDLVGAAGQERFVRFRGITGSAPNGIVGNGPMTIMGYPGEDVVIQCLDDTRCGIHGVDGYNLDGGILAADSDWITISNLRIRVGGPKVKDGPINLQHRSDNWRIVNNELFNWDGNDVDGKIIDGNDYGEARAGGITGDGTTVKILGNYIHDINGGTKNHGIYIDGGAQNWEIAYNHMERLFGGNIIQTFDSHGNGGNITNIDIHHNLLHDGTRYGINYSTGTASGKIYDNIIYNIAASGLRFSTSSGSNIQAVHNTLYNTCLKTGLNALDTSPTTKIPSNAAALANDWSGDRITIKNNIVHSNTNCTTYLGNTGTYNTMLIDSNLYTGLSVSPPGKDINAVTGNPAFVNTATADFRILAGSAAIDTASTTGFVIPTDFFFAPRTINLVSDLGAVEFQ